MANELKDFKRLFEDLANLEGASKTAYSPELDERASSRSVFNDIGARHLPGYAAPDFEANPDIASALRGQVATLIEPKVRGYFGSNLDEILGQIEPKQLAKRVFDSPPVKTHDSKHDYAAELHERKDRYEGIIRKIENRDPKGFKELANEVEKYVTEQLKSTNFDRNNKYLTKDEIKKAAKFVKKIAESNQQFAVNMLVRLRDQTEEEFEEFLKSDEERAEYATVNIRAYQAKGPKEALETASRVYRIAA